VTRLEIAANVCNTASVVLATRNSVHLWWTGIIGTALFAIVFVDADLLASATLQVFFVATSIVGWVHWARRGDRPELPVRHASLQRLAVHAALAVPAVALYALVLERHTGAVATGWDSFVLGASAFAQYLLMGRRVETWPGWLVVNTVSVPLYLSQGLRLTAGLYALYWVNAWVGWAQWRRELRSQAQPQVTSPETPRLVSQ
jgi:nicotinamide mononucleotide transporter